MLKIMAGRVGCWDPIATSMAAALIVAGGDGAV